QQRPHKHARHQRERHGHAEITEKQKTKRHQGKDHERAHGRALVRTAVSTGGIGRSSSGGSGWSKPLRMPLTSCSIVNSAISAPEIGIAAYSEAIGVIDGMRKLPKPRRKLM